MDSCYDVVVIGGGPAGMSAALVMARALVKGCVINDETPLEKFQDPTYNFITNDGLSKCEILEKSKSDIGRYDNFSYIDDLVEEVGIDIDGYRIRLKSGLSLRAGKVIFALGDKLDPSSLGIEGIESIWGRSLFTCPYCHGYEIQGKDVVVLFQGQADVNLIKLLGIWAGAIRVFVGPGVEPRDVFAAIGRVAEKTDVSEARIASVNSESGQLKSLITEEGEVIPADAIFVSDMESHPNHLIDSIYTSKKLNPMTNRELYETDQFGRTGLGDVFIVGDAKTRFSTLIGAAHEGFIAGVMVINDLLDNPA
ncbi:NAD(P)/FAD-dependent oxidoreductase [Microbulbifer sediminum]|uniref:NAD(P)/FAD-dependent oxidoreductase n=1 Tax=Microbulbifer sediminum TaxID=2904250 RepID=UPI0021063039|nr:NAD(P)/FAD-dependent oxidoreductase [Microbulbifer sediminum]